MKNTGIHFSMLGLRAVVLARFLLLFYFLHPHNAIGESQMTKAKYMSVYDKKGNEFSISVDEWRTNVLPHNIKENWNDPEGLYSLIHMAFKDGFGKDVLAAAQHLKEIKPDERSYSTLGVLQLQQRQLADAEKTFNEQMQNFGRSSFVLNYLAKIYADTGRQDQVNDLLFESLKLNPNEENALAWWSGLKNDEGGKEAWRNALKEISAFAGSWRAQLWLGRDALERDKNEEAIRLFKEVLKIAPDEYDALFPISGDLGQKGLIDDLIALIAPIYKPSSNNIMVGINLLTAYQSKKNYQAGLELVERLKQVERYDFTDKLNYYFAEFNRLKQENTPQS